MVFRMALTAALLLLPAFPAASVAEEAGTEPAASTEPSAPASSADALTPEEKAEKEARKACKIEICGVLATKDPAGPDISCDIVKTWRGAAITKMLGGKFDWPWGNAVCQSKLVIKREVLAKAMSEARYEVVMPSQKLSCTLDQKKEGKPYIVDVTVAPKVTFENGKAVNASLNWGEASGPMLVYALIYAGTGLDNASKVLGPEVVRMTNEFTGKKCAEVGKDLPDTH
jgi:hypothetical protein